MNPDMLSTGRAAKLCSVTPDTVLKWIKKNQIQAVKTPGGHYRIDKEQLKPYMSGMIQDHAPSIESVQASVAYCWEYHADNGHITDSCRECMVFKSKAEKCYLMAGLGENGGHAQAFCKENCYECEYFKFVNKTPTSVLVITEDAELQAHLKMEAADSLMLKFSCCGYETAMVVQDFRPDFIIIDESLASSSSDEICRHLIDDPRVHGSQIVLASASRNTRNQLPDGVCASIGMPFTAHDLKECLRNLNHSFFGERPVTGN